MCASVCACVYGVIDKELSGRQILGLVWSAFLPGKLHEVDQAVMSVCVDVIAAGDRVGYIRGYYQGNACCNW